MYSAEEIADLEIKTEQSGKEFYEYAAKQVKNRSLKETLDFLAMQEESHRKKFETLKGGMKKLIQPQDIEGVEGYINAIVTSQFFIGNDKALVKAMTAKNREELLSFALQFEKETLLFFTQISELSEGKTKDVLNEIINEEKKHVKIITELLRQQEIE